MTGLFFALPSDLRSHPRMSDIWRVLLLDVWGLSIITGTITGVARAECLVFSTYEFIIPLTTLKGREVNSKTHRYLGWICANPNGFSYAYGFRYTRRMGFCGVTRGVA